MIVPGKSAHAVTIFSAERNIDIFKALLKPYEDTKDLRIGAPFVKLWQTTTKGNISSQIRHISAF